jgi:hypothetical protein
VCLPSTVTVRILEISSGDVQNKRLSPYGKDAQKAPNACPIANKNADKFLRVAASIRELLDVTRARSGALRRRKQSPTRSPSWRPARCGTGTLTAEEFDARKTDLPPRL